MSLGAIGPSAAGIEAQLPTDVPAGRGLTMRKDAEEAHGSRDSEVGWRCHQWTPAPMVAVTHFASEHSGPTGWSFAPQSVTQV